MALDMFEAQLTPYAREVYNILKTHSTITRHAEFKFLQYLPELRHWRNSLGNSTLHRTTAFDVFKVIKNGAIRYAIYSDEDDLYTFASVGEMLSKAVEEEKEW